MKFFLLAVVLLFAVPASLSADQEDPRLDILFDVLAEAPNHQQAWNVEQLIWAVWLEHENERVERMMSVSAAAMGEGLLEAALGEVDKVVAQAPDYAEGWNRRATILYMMNRFEDSLADIEQVLQLEPRHFGALSGRGLCYMAMGRLEEAEVALIAALEIHPQMPGAARNLQFIKRQLGNPI
ncbi:MAG: tetratricopeptide repeat protein [Kiloniellales bacterium]